MIKQHIFHFSLSSFYLQNLVVVYEVQMFRCTIFRIHKYSILHYAFIEFIILLYTFLAVSFAQYKEYIIWRVSLSKFSDVLSACTFGSAIGSLLSVCLGLNISRFAQSKFKRSPFPFCCLSKLKISSTISITFSRFSLLGISFFELHFLNQSAH